MKLAIFGGSGRTGVHLVVQALAAWHDMVALIRNPAKLALRHDRLRVAQGESTDEVAVADAVRGADAVLASLSPKILGGPRGGASRVGNGHCPGRDARTPGLQARLQLVAEHRDSPQSPAAGVAQRELRPVRAAAHYPLHGQRDGSGG